MDWLLLLGQPQLCQQLCMVTRNHEPGDFHLGNFATEQPVLDHHTQHDKYLTNYYYNYILKESKTIYYIIIIIFNKQTNLLIIADIFCYAYISIYYKINVFQPQFGLSP